MKHGRKLLGALLIAAVFAGQIAFRGGTAIADVNPSVILDGNMLSFSVPPRIINDRCMVPYRAIGEAMGATVLWDDATRAATVLLNDRYVILYTGNPIMYYGTHTINFMTGETEYSVPLTITLDAPPVIIEDYTFVPLRALTEGLGAIVEWNDPAKTVIISSPQREIPAVPTAEPTPRPDVFEQTNWFQVISGARAQLMYDNNEQFILIYFSGDDPVAEQYLPELKLTARNFGYKIYGVDAKSEPPGSGDLSFIWNYSPMYSIVYPLVFFVNGKNDIDWIFGPSTQNDLDNRFDMFVYKSKFAPATPTPVTEWNGGWNVWATPTPRPSPTPTPNLNTYWSNVDRSFVDNLYYGDQKFILVYYHSHDTDSKRLLDTVKEASVNAGVPVYACDAYSYSESDIWWGKSYVSNQSFLRFPTVFYVNKRSVSVNEQPTDVDMLALSMRNFINNVY